MVQIWTFQKRHYIFSTPHIFATRLKRHSRVLCSSPCRWIIKGLRDGRIHENSKPHYSTTECRVCERWLQILPICFRLTLKHPSGGDTTITAPFLVRSRASLQHNPAEQKPRRAPSVYSLTVVSIFIGADSLSTFNPFRSKFMIGRHIKRGSMRQGRSKNKVGGKGVKSFNQEL